MFKHNLPIVLRNAFSEHLLQQIRAHIFQSAPRSPRYRSELNTSKSFSVYADPLMEQLLNRCLPLLENRLGASLYPTYSYYQLYRKGAEVVPHRERPACEITLLINASHAKEPDWPLHLQESGKAVSIKLRSGDAILYKSAESIQWRNKFEGDDALFIALHYVTQAGPYADWKFDRRPELGPLTSVKHHAHVT